MPAARSILAAVVAAVLAAVAVLAWRSSLPDVYESRSLLAVDGAPATVAAAGGRPENIVFLARTYAARATTAPVLKAAVERSGIDATIEEARRRTSVDVSTANATIEVVTSGPSRDAAHDLNVAVVESLTEQLTAEQAARREELIARLDAEVATLEASLAAPGDGARRAVAQHQYQTLVATRAELELQPLDDIEVLSPADLPRAPVAPQPERDAILAAFVAAVVVIEVIVARRMFRRDALAGGPPHEVATV